MHELIHMHMCVHAPTCNFVGPVSYSCSTHGASFLNGHLEMATSVGYSWPTARPSSKLHVWIDDSIGLAFNIILKYGPLICVLYTMRSRAFQILSPW